MRDIVMLGEKCGECGKNRWEAFSSHLRCPCGRKAWIVRYRDDVGGVRFRFGQGAELPEGYLGWSAITR